jgi:primosomal protein N' (replication factor Y)
VTYTPSHCPSCGAQHWQLVGQGTQKLEEALIGLFPNTPILRLDRDNLQGKGALETALAQAHKASGQILLGTQLLAKGHDIANIGLVGIVDVDGALFARDYRALERLAQLVTQVSGRAGRGKKGGCVLLQTHQPQHPFIQALLHQSYTEIAADLLKAREQAQLPPFAFGAYLLAEGRKAERVRQYLEKLLNLPCHPKVQIAGPMTALMHKRQHHYRELLWLQSASRSALHQQITAYLDALNAAEFRTNSVKVSWDIDPQDMP